MNNRNLLRKIGVYGIGAVMLAASGPIGCVSTKGNSMYSAQSSGSELEIKDRIHTQETYQKNLVRNFNEAMQTTMSKGSGYGTLKSTLGGKPKTIVGVDGLVKAMQKERYGDLVKGAVILGTNALVTYGLIAGITSNDDTQTITKVMPGKGFNEGVGGKLETGTIISNGITSQTPVTLGLGFGGL